MMTAQRRGEIAYTLFREKLSKDGIRFDSLKRDLGNIAASSGVSVPEIQEFFNFLFLDLFVGLSPEQVSFGADFLKRFEGKVGA